MRLNLLVGLLLLAGILCTRPICAQDGGAEDDAGRLMMAGEALDQKTCRDCADRIMQGIEEWTRMKFRRPVPISVMPRASWERAIKRDGYGGQTARRGAAFYSPMGNAVMVVPWVIGGYATKPIPKRSREEWIAALESTIIHEFCHALHFQNFHIVATDAQAASLRKEGLSARQKDESTAEFLISEGFAELVSFRIATLEAKMRTRRPQREVDSPQRYWDRYQPNGTDAFRSILFNSGYQDGIDLLDRLARKAGPRAVRGVLYRTPARELLFQPDVLATVAFDDPPDPDSIFAFLSPGALRFGEVHLAVNPGEDRFFRRARSQTGMRRQAGCLLGFMARRGSESDEHGESTYAFFVSDPDNPHNWSAEQAESFRAIDAKHTREKKVSLARLKGVKASVIEVKIPKGPLWIRAEANGMVVLARETKPTKSLETRVLLALRTLQIRRPTPHLYDAALKKARAKIDKSKAD